MKKSVFCVAILAVLMCAAGCLRALELPLAASPLGVEFIKEQEGFSPFVFWDEKHWTIGYGTTVGEDDYPEGITQEEATALLTDNLHRYENAISAFAERYEVSLTQPRFDALVSFTYNLGGGIWADDYEDFLLRQYLREGVENFSRAEIAQAFENWCYSGGVVVPGLLNRRGREAVVFQSAKADANGDGAVDISDIMAARDHIFGTAPLTGYAFWRADTNDDGAVNIGDILRIRDVIFGLD